jgi:hypothetical protein
MIKEPSSSKKYHRNSDGTIINNSPESNDYEEIHSTSVPRMFIVFLE